MQLEFDLEIEINEGLSDITVVTLPPFFQPTCDCGICGKNIFLHESIPMPQYEEISWCVLSFPEWKENKGWRAVCPECFILHERRNIDN